MKKQSLLDKLIKELASVEKKLEKHRTNCAVLLMEMPRTQRRWKTERNWDYYGKRKFELQGLIEDEKIGILKENGWYQWKSETHWVHSDILDYFRDLGMTYFVREHTNYQCTLDEAWRLYTEVQQKESFGK